jgi:hypothetical protein
MFSSSRIKQKGIGKYLPPGSSRGKIRFFLFFTSFKKWPHFAMVFSETLFLNKTELIEAIFLEVLKEVMTVTMH